MATPFVMTFLGDAARFEARAENGRAFVGDRPVSIELPPATGGAMAVFCRPWEMALASPREAHVIGTIHAVRRAGGIQRIEIELPSGERVEVEASAASPLRAGDKAGLLIKRAQSF